MPLNPLQDPDFYSLLFKIDRNHAEEARQKGCPACGAPLHWANDSRSPRGGTGRCRDEQLTRFTPATIAKYELRYSEILVGGRKQRHPSPPPNGRKRGRPKRSKAENLLERLLEFQRETLGFIHDFRIPFDNNQAERDGRMMKVQQKISGTFRSQLGAKRFARTRGYISTVRKNGKAVLEAIRNVFLGTPFFPKPWQESKT